MGNHVSSTTEQAQLQIRNQVTYYVPKRHSIIDATEKAPPAGAREMSISATSHLVSPDQVEFSLIDGAIRNGYVDKLRLFFDALDYSHFGPKISRTLSHIDRVQTLEIYCDMLPRVAILQFFSYPNVLDSLPPQLPTLSVFYLATTFHQLVYFDVLAKVMLRCPRLLCLKLEGPLIAHTANDYSDYIPCRLEMLILKYCRMTTGTFKEILIRSGHCLEVLHLEMIQGIDRTELAIIIGACLPSLKMLTIITPDPSSTAVTMIEMQGIMDYILAQPLPSLVYLYLSGLSITKEALTRKANHIGVIVSPLPILQTLSIHYTIQFPMRALVIALMEGKLPLVIRLEAIYSLSEVDVETYTALCQVCAERGIFMSEAMTKVYAPLVSASAMSKDLAGQALDDEIDEITRNRDRTAAVAEAGRATHGTFANARLENESRSRHHGQRRRKHHDRHYRDSDTRHGHSRSGRRHGRKSAARREYERDMSIVASEYDSSDSTSTTSTSDSEDSRDERRSSRRSGRRRHAGRSSGGTSRDSSSRQSGSSRTSR